MNKYRILSLFIFAILAAFLLGGCGQYQKIKDVKSIAFVGARFNRQFVKTDHNGKGGGTADLFSLVGGQILGIEPLKNKEKKFFDSFLQLVISVFESESFSIVTPESFKDDPTYVSIKEDPLFTPRMFYYVPEPYHYIQLAGHAEDAKKLCKALNVDAVASFDFNFLRMQEKVMFVIGAERLGLQGWFWLIDKEGNLVYNESFLVRGKEAMVKLFDKFGFVLTEDNEKLYTQVTTAFVKHLQGKIVEAKKQAGLL